MKPSPISTAILVVSLLLAPALFAQAPASENQSGASPAQRLSAAEVPRLIKFNSTLLDAQERPMAGPVGVTFALYSHQTGGAALWVETQNVKPDASGAYVVLLGANSANGVPAELFTSGEARWLGIQVGQQPEHERILLVSVPYALKAGDAETLGGLPASAFVTTGVPGSTANSGGAAGVSSSTGLPKPSTATTPKKVASTPQPATACSSVTSDGTATANSIGLFTTACNIQSSVITQSSGNVGIGTAAPAVAVDVVGNNAGLRLSGTGTHQVTVTGASSGRLGQDATGFFFSSDTSGKVIKFLTNNGTLNEWMRITSAGNVGIGTATPGAKLEIAGNLRVSAGGTALTANGIGAGAIGVQGTSNDTNGIAGLFTNSSGNGEILSANNGTNEVFAVGSLGLKLKAPIIQQIPNDATTGTVVAELAKFTSAGTVVVTSPGDSGGALGVVVGETGASGTTAKAVVAFIGTAQCNFDNTAVVADYIQISPTAAGQCHDAGSAYPATGQVIGRVIDITKIPPQIYLIGSEVRGAAPDTLNINAVSFSGFSSLVTDSQGLVQGPGAMTLGYAAADLPNGSVITGFHACGRDFGNPDQFIAG